jgi:drug/metabolite transporter (DMT)-like permease
MKLKLSGPVLMILAQIAFTIMVVFVKIARQEMSTFEVAFWRSIIAVPFLMLMYRNISWKIHDRFSIALRTGLGFGALCSFFAAAKGLSIADLSLISKIQPMLVALIAPLILGNTERASSKIWFLIAISMCGCSILLAPSLQVGSLYGIFALSAAIFSAHAHIFIRRLKNEHSGIVVLWFQSGSGVLALLFCLVTQKGISIPNFNLWIPLIGVGLSATIGQLLMTWAYKKNNAAPIALASYIGPLFAVLADLVAFQVFPTWNVYLGGSIVVLSGFALIKSHSN